MGFKGIFKGILEEQIEAEMEAITYEWPPQCMGFIYQPERPETEEK